MKCPACKDEFYTKIEGEKDTITDTLLYNPYEGNYLCLNCMTVFSENGKIIERG